MCATRLLLFHVETHRDFDLRRDRRAVRACLDAPRPHRPDGAVVEIAISQSRRIIDLTSAPKLLSPITLAPSPFSAPHSVIRDHVHRLPWLRADLAQHRRHLTTVIARVVDDVLEHLPDR